MNRLYVAMVALIAVLPARAEEWLVPAGDLVALTNAVKQAAENDVITLAEGTYAFKDAGMAMRIDGTDEKLFVTNWLYISKAGVELRGDPAASRDNVVIDANGEHCRAVYVDKNDVRLSNITFRNGFGGKGCPGIGNTAELRGGAVNFMKRGIVSNCCFTACESAGYGAIYGTFGSYNPSSTATWDRPKPKLIDCRFESCKGVAAFGGDHYGCVFYGNEQAALARGSASNCWFEANTGVSGSAVQLEKTTLANGTIEPQEFIDCTFVGNESTGTTSSSTVQQGGAVVIQAGPASQTNIGTNLFLRCHFRDNTTKGSGGAVLQCSKANCLPLVSRFVDCDFTGNVASYYGGAICDVGFYNGIEDRGLIVEGGVFSGNSIDTTRSGDHRESDLDKISAGGAVAGAEVHGATITNNWGYYLGGGGFYGRYYGCTFADNLYTMEIYGAGGGAAYRLEYATNCTFTLHGQRTREGNGAVLLNPGIVRNCVFKDNVCVFDHAKPSRSMIESRAGAMHLSDCIITNCPGDRGYSTVLNSSDSRASVVRCRFQDCCGRTELCDEASKASYISVENCDAVDCQFDGGMTVSSATGGSAVRCTFENVDLSSASATSLIRNTGDFPFAITNCLVAGCTAAPSAYLLQRAKSVVNCTFVDNDLHLCKAGIAYSNCLVNCLFYGTVGKSDLDHRANADTCVVVENCMFQTNTQGFDTSLIDGGGNVVLEGAETPVFNRLKYPDYPYYMPLRSSKAIGAGAQIAGLVGETDLFGAPRYTDGRIGIGCYECSIPQQGMLLFVR